MSWNHHPEMPGRIRAALDYLGYCTDTTRAYDCIQDRHELSPAQAAVQAAALDVLRMYFQGEMDYGDAPPRPPSEPPESPPAPVPVHT